MAGIYDKPPSRDSGSGGGIYGGKAKGKAAGGYTAAAAPGDKSFLDQAKRAGGGSLLFALKALDAPRAAVDKLNTFGPTIGPVIGPKSLQKDARIHVGNLVPGFGQLAGVGRLRDQHPKGIPGFLRNTTVDIVQDPLTYLSFGTGSGAKAGLKAVAKHLGEDVAKDVVERGAQKALGTEARKLLRAGIVAQEGGSEKAATRVLKALDKSGQGGLKIGGRTVIAGKHFKPVTEPISNAVDKAVASRVGEALIPRAAIRSTLGKSVAADVGAAAARARAAAGNRSEDTLRSIVTEARAAKVTTPELEHIVLPALDIGGDKVAVPARLMPLVDRLKAIRQDATERQVAEGILPNARDTETYVPLDLTEAGKRALSSVPDVAERHGMVPTELSAAMKQGGHLHERTLLPDRAVTDVDKIVGGQLRDAGKLRGSLVEKNPALLVGRRAAQAEKAIANKHLVDELATMSHDGQPLLLKAAEGIKRPAGWVEGGTPEIGKFYAPQAIANEVERVRAVITNDEALREFSGLLGHLNTLWKGYATVPIIGGGGFHLRNAMGNVWNNFLAGVKNPADYARAAKIQATLTKGGEEALSQADRELVDLAKKHGVLDSGFFLSELTSPRSKGGRLARAATDRKLAAGTLNPLSTDNVIIRSGRSVGSGVENNARLAHFIAKLKELGSADEAARSVKTHLFDYADLTPTERSIKKVVAFWTFMRKNTPLQIAALAQQPGKFSGLGHVWANAAGQAPAGTYPQWAIDEGLIPVGGMMVGADLPATAAAESFSIEPSALVGQAGGLLPSVGKALAEQATGSQIFSGIPLKKVPQDQPLLKRLWHPGHLLRRTIEAAVPPVGKVERAPYTAFATGDEQAPARTVSALTGLTARKLTASDKGEGDGKKKKTGKGIYG